MNDFDICLLSVVFILIFKDSCLDRNDYVHHLDV